MRYYILLIVLAIANCASAQLFGRKYNDIEPAKIVVNFTLKYQQDSTNSAAIKTTDLLLFLGENISWFISKAGYINDTASRKFTSNEQVMMYQSNPQVPRSGIQYQIYKNYPKGKLTYIEHIPSNTYKFEEDVNLFNWNLTNDTSTFYGFRVQKATCEFGGRSWIAWFSPEIPYSDGPYKFNGLPGLIVKIYDTHNHYKFELVSINKYEPGLMINIKDKEYIVTTKQGFFKAQDSFREDIISRAKEAGMDNNSQQVAAKNMAMRNNPIELIRK